MSQRLLHCDLSKWIINQKGRFVREGTSVSYKRYNMTGAGLRRGRVETVGVLCSGASSFAAPLKVNKELSNGPVMLIKKKRRKKKKWLPLSSNFTRTPFSLLGVTVLSLWFVRQGAHTAVSVLYWMINASESNHKARTIWSPFQQSWTVYPLCT